MTSRAFEADEAGASWLSPGLVTTVTPLSEPSTDRPQPAWFAGTIPMAAPVPYGPPPAVDPLFLPRWTRAILSGALSVRSPEGALDIDRIVERMAELQPMAILPRTSIPTLRFGVQLLVDMGDAMMPWSEDVRVLREAVESVVGRDRCAIRYFEGSPSRVEVPGRDGWVGWEPPTAPTVVVAITDLGIGRPMAGAIRATTSDWLAVAGAARRARTPMVAFVPYPAERVPAPLRQAMTIIPWDRPTSSGDVHRLVGRGLPGLAG